MTDIKLKIDYTPITLDNFFEGHHYMNMDNVYDDSKKTVLNVALAFNTLEKIQDAESIFQETEFQTLTQHLVFFLMC